jgi:TolB-like protein
MTHDATSLSGETLPARASRWWRRLARWRFGPLKTAGLVLLVVAAVALAIFGTRAILERRERVLAVLPMEIGGGDAVDSTEAAVVLESLGEELIARLHAAGGFRVLPWVTSGRRLAPSMSLRDAAAEMRATHVLIGRILNAEEAVRVRLALVRGRDGKEQWSRDLSAAPGDYAGLQGQVALAVAEGMSGRLNAATRERIAADAPRDPGAYAFFVRGASAIHSADPGLVATARSLFEHALALNSTLAGAWVALGGTYLQEAYFGNEGEASNEAARRCFERALELRPGLPVAERGLLRVSFESVGRGEVERRLAIAARALERGPDDVDQLTTAILGFTLSSQAPLGVPVVEHAVKLDPGNRELAWYRVLALTWGGYPARALAAGADYVRRFGEDAEVYTRMGGCSMRLGRHEQAVRFLERAVELFGPGSWNVAQEMLVHAYALSEDEAKSAMQRRRMVGELERKTAANPSNRRLALGLMKAYMESDDVGGVRHQAEVLRRLAEELDAGSESSDRTDLLGAEVELAEALANAGMLAQARAVLQRASPADENGWEAGNGDSSIVTSPSPESEALYRTPEWRALMEGREAILDTLFAKYGPVVAAALPREPDLPATRRRTAGRKPK